MNYLTDLLVEKSFSRNFQIDFDRLTLIMCGKTRNSLARKFFRQISSNFFWKSFNLTEFLRKKNAASNIVLQSFPNNSKKYTPLVLISNKQNLYIHIQFHEKKSYLKVPHFLCYFYDCSNQGKLEILC